MTTTMEAPFQMLTKHSRILRLLAVLLLVTLVGAACGDDDDEGGGAGSADTGGDTAEAELSGTLNASGSSFQQAFEEVCIEAYKEVQPDVTVNYGGGGSGKGKQDLADGVVDFAGTDSLVKPEDMSKYPSGVLYIPIASAPITVSYNLEGVEELRLSPATIAKIFSRQVKTWNDAAIKADNPDATLPGSAITVVHRADSSGTTENFTKFLAAAAPEAWTITPGSTVEWPSDTQAGNGNSGVASAIKAASGAIGYVDLSDAKASGLSLAEVENKAGAFVEPTTDAAAAAVDSATVAADLTYDPLWTDGNDAYPITSPTWILVPKSSENADLLKSYLGFVVGECQELAGDADFAALPDDLAGRAAAAVESIAAGTAGP